MNKTLPLCVAGIYFSFLSWSFLQERLNTQAYDGEIFKSPLMINVFQSLLACFVGTCYLSLKMKKLALPTSFIFDNGVWQRLAGIALTQSVSSPMGYASLSHVSYLTFLLAKSCKLIPVMMVSFLVYKKTFPLYKVCIALSITAGVLVFTLNQSSKKVDSNDGNTVRGLSFLCVSLLLDGLTNSSQDALLRSKKLTGAHLMAGLNFISFLFTLSYVLLFTSQMQYFIDFSARHPQVIGNVVSFSLFGSLGQIFIFITLEKFDSILLTTVTVTRKMISMVVSVMWFGHTLNPAQWAGVALVFSGIGVEAMLKNKNKNKKKMD